jgi:hypothetical protein
MTTVVVLGVVDCRIHGATIKTKAASKEESSNSDTTTSHTAAM